MGKQRKPETETVRLSKDLLKRIRRVSSHLDISVPDWLADRIAPILLKEEKAMLKAMTKELDGASDSGE